MRRAASSPDFRTLARRAYLARVVGMLAAMAAPGLAACAQTPSPPAPAPTQVPTSAPTQAPAPAKAPTPVPTPVAKPAATVAPTAVALRKWRIGLPSSPSFINTFQMMGSEKGFQKEAGFEVEYVRASTPVAVKALVAGELDMTDFTIGNIMSAVAGGSDLRLVGSISTGMDFVVYTQQDIKSIRDLVGRNVGITNPGDLAHFTMLGLLLDQKVDPERVNWVSLGQSGATMFQALVAGKIDAYSNPMDFVPEVPKYPSIKVLVGVREVLPKMVRSGIAVQAKTIADRPADLERVLGAYVKGARYTLDNRDEAIALAKRITSREQDIITFVYDWHVKNQIITPDLELPPDSIQYMQDLNVAIKQQDRGLPLDRIFDGRIQQRVIATIGKYRR